MIYDIHRCSTNEKSAVVDFIRKYWSETHIFTYCDKLLYFQHLNQQGGYNFIVATNIKTGEIDGLVGYIPLAHFDEALATHGDQWGAIWKVRNDVKNDEIGLLGLLLFERVSEMGVSHGSIGISDVARKYYKIQKQTLGSLSQYYIVNRKCTDFKIAALDSAAYQITDKTTPKSKVTLREVSLEEAKIVECVYVPRKSVKYIENRYINHPIYRYKLLGVFDSFELCCVLVVRHINTQGACCVRIVDVYGSLESSPNIYSAVQHYLDQNSAEYLDCLNYGINSAEFERLGFSILDPSQNEIIIPNYFEPFLRENVLIELAYRAPKGYPYIVFKGDADQDRPNMI